MDPIKFAIENPVKVSVGVLLLLLFGFVSLFTIPIQLTPDVDQPVITVETNWVGRSPEEVEKDIIEEQEEYLKSISNLRKLEASATQGRASITLEFFVGTDLDRALLDVTNALDEVPSYPDEVDRPIITAADSASENAIAWVILDSEDPDFDIQSFYTWADNRVIPQLERIEGVSQINLYGGREREVHIQVDPRELAQRGVTFNELINAVRGDNVNVSAGELQEGMYDVRVRTVGQYDQLDPIRQTVIKTDPTGGPIRVGDVANVELTLEKRRSFVRANGREAMAINAIRETGANVISIMEDFRVQLADINENLLPLYENDQYKLRLRQVYDETVYINDAVGLARSNLIIGGVLAGAVLLLYLRKVRPTTIIALAIPTSVIGTFVVLVAGGRNLNVISLAGLAFAVGMVVDNAIVVLENIDRHLNMCKLPLRAAYDGSKEVWGAILASTLTTLAVFAPVLTIQEEAGQLFFDISLAIVAAVSLSLIVSITVIPSASARWLRQRHECEGGGVETEGKSAWSTKIEHLLDRIVTPIAGARDAWAGFIYWISGRDVLRVLLRLGIVTLFMVAAVWGSYILMPPASYLPAGNQNLIFGIMLTPPGYNIDQVEYIGERVESHIRPYWEADSIPEATAIAEVRGQDGTLFERVPPIGNYFFVTFNSNVFMGAASEDKELVQPLGPVLSGAMMSIPGSFGFAAQRSIFGRGLSGTNAFDLELYGNDIAALRNSATALYTNLIQKPGYGPGAVRPDPLNFNLAGKERQLEIDQVKAKSLNVDANELGSGMRALIDGLEVGDYRFEGDNIDLLLTRDPSYPLTVDTLGQVPLAVVGDDGEPAIVPIAQLGTVRETQSPQEIKRIEEQRAIAFSITPPEGRAIEQAEAEVLAVVEELRASGQIAPDIVARPAGTSDKLADVRAALLGRWHGFTFDSVLSLLQSRMFLALLIVYLLMAALFESFLYPFVIMFSVPLAVVGGFGGLAIMHAWDPTQQLDTLTMLGFVILIGVVVNNAILIVHQALNYMRGLGEGEGDTTGALAPREALQESVRTRIRPIFMTTTTSVLGMLPLVLAGGSGSELYKGLGSVVVGGLATSTLFTLLIVPLMFSLVLDAKRWVLGLFNREFVERREPLVVS